MGNDIPIFPGGGGGNGNGNGGGNNTPSGPPSPPSGGGGGGNGGGGGGGGGGNPYLAAQRKANNKAARRYLDQAAGLNEQVEALRKALNKGFMQALETRLANVRLVARQQDRMLMSGYRDRVEGLAGSVSDNQQDASDQSYANLSNRGRERASQLSEAMAQGAGESDVLRAQMMSLRNWDANQAEVNRSFFDTLRSANSSLNDLNVDTRTARSNVAIESNADLEQLWTSYYAQRSEALTNLGNIYGQQAELYGMAQEMGGKGAKKKRKRTENLMGSAFDDATTAISQSWVNPGVPQRIRRWDGRDDFEGQMNNARYDAEAGVEMDRPEGATLRKW